MYKEREKTGSVGGPEEIGNTAMGELGRGLDGRVYRAEMLINEIKSRLQLILKLNPLPVPTPIPVPKPEPECVMDEITLLLSKMSDNNDKLEDCLEHLKRII